MSEINNDSDAINITIKKSTIKDRLNQTKYFLLENAPAIAVTVSAITIGVVAIQQRQQLSKLSDDMIRWIDNIEWNRDNNASTIDACVNLGIPFVYYPGVGVRPDNLEDLEKISAYKFGSISVPDGGGITVQMD